MGRLFLILSLGSYAVSFFLPTFAVIVEGKLDEPAIGFTAFLICLMNAWGLDGVAPLITWLANPLFWVAVVTHLAGRQRVVSLSFAVLAVPLGMTFVFEPTVFIGYYAWLTSFLLLIVAIVCGPISQSNE